MCSRTDASGWVMARILDWGKVEDEHLGAFAALELERAARGLQCIARHERLAVYRQRAAHHMHVALAPRGDLQAGARGAVEQAGVERRILVDGDGAVAPIARGDEAQPAALVTVGEVLLLVGR